jgi:hypothetical protein
MELGSTVLVKRAETKRVVEDDRPANLKVVSHEMTYDILVVELTAPIYDVLYEVCITLVSTVPGTWYYKYYDTGTRYKERPSTITNPSGCRPIATCRMCRMMDRIFQERGIQDDV